jgi:putative transposase
VVCQSSRQAVQRESSQSTQRHRLKALEKENAKLKRVVAELSLEKQVLKDIAEGNF